MSNCRVTPKNTVCNPGESSSNNSSVNCPPFSACLPFGQSIQFDGNCFTLTGHVTIADGWYQSILVENGCITDAKEGDIPAYVPAPCADAPTACGDSGGGGGGCTCDITLNPEAGNILTYTNDQLDGHIYIGQNTGITVSGAATQNDPLVFKVDAVDTSVYINSGSPSILTISGDGSQTSPYSIVIANSPLAAGWYGPFNSDAYGRLIGYDSSRESDFKGVTDSATITMSNNSGLISASLIDLKVNGQYTFGGMQAVVDTYGRLTAVNRIITITAGVYQFGIYNVTVNEYGSITKIEVASQDDAVIPQAFFAAFRGDPSATGTDRVMSFTAQNSGIFHFEYRGFLGNTTASPGLHVASPSGVSADIDGTAFSNIYYEVIAGMVTNSIIAVGGMTGASIVAGQHTVTLNTGSTVIEVNDGIMRVEFVGAGT